MKGGQRIGKNREIAEEKGFAAKQYFGKAGQQQRCGEESKAQGIKRNIQFARFRIHGSAECQYEPETGGVAAVRSRYDGTNIRLISALSSLGNAEASFLVPQASGLQAIKI